MRMVAFREGLTGDEATRYGMQQAADSRERQLKLAEEGGEASEGGGELGQVEDSVKALPSEKKPCAQVPVAAPEMVHRRPAPTACELTSSDGLHQRPRLPGAEPLPGQV